MRRGKIIVRILIGILLLSALASVGFVLWALDAAQPMPEALAAMQSGPDVAVETGPDWTTFRPAGANPAAGLILYPGGRVDWRAYAPAARRIAACGNLVAIAPMPLNLALFGVNAAGKIQAAYPEIGVWAVGGHSMGGAFTAQYAYEHPDELEGLLLWASYPSSDINFSDREIKVLSVSGSLDGLATPQKIEASRSLLPADTRWLVVEGGNHAQFGWYGSQSGDLEAKVSREAQQEEMIASACEFLKELTGEERP